MKIPREKKIKPTRFQYCIILLFYIHGEAKNVLNLRQ